MRIFKLKHLVVCLFLLQSIYLFAQRIDFAIEQLPFSSSVNDEFSPMYYNNGLVFSSNSLSNASIKSEGGRLFNIVYAAQKDSGNFKSPEIFSKELTTILNEGPVSFSADANTIYYARNNLIEGKFKDINSPSNTMGIYMATFSDGVWGNIQAFPHNSKDYSIGTPAISPDGNRLYFASDMPGGKGGADLYYSEWKNGQWQSPVNMLQINTEGNESYPFVSADEKLFFASDGHPGLGGKDIFYSVEYKGQWQKPIHLGQEINSTSDDFGLITNVNFSEGFFSSDRKHSLDIYSFNSVSPQFGYCDTLVVKPQCFEFYDDRFTDSLHLDYEWNFGKGIIKFGYKVSHCYPNAGDYEVILTITHNLADSVFKTKAVHRFSIENNTDIAINSKYFAVLGEKVDIVGYNKSFSDFKVKLNYWGFGNGLLEGELDLSHKFEQLGTHYITYGISGEADGYGRIPRKCFMKPVLVLDDYQQLANEYRKIANIESEAEGNPLLFSPDKNVEQYGMYGYILAEDLPIIEVDRIETVFEKPPWRIDVERGQLAEVSNAYLSDLAISLAEFKNIRLAIAVHSGSKGSEKSKFEETQSVLEAVLVIFAKSGIDVDVAESRGYGSSRPMFSNKEKNANAMNQRIEFIVLDANIEE